MLLVYLFILLVVVVICRHMILCNREVKYNKEDLEEIIWDFVINYNKLIL